MDVSKDQLFHLTFWGAAVLYTWGIFIMWFGPEWVLSGRTYLLLGVLPVMVGVVLLAAAMGVYVDLLKED